MSEPLAETLHEALISTSESTPYTDTANVTDGLFAIARALDGVARALYRLGNADAATPLGALEALGMAQREAATEIAEAIAGLSRD